MPADPEWLWAKLVDTLRLVALSADEQVAALPDSVHVPDEVALLYDDVYVLVPQLVAASLITPQLQSALQRVDELFSEMSATEDKSAWTLAALHDDPRWDESRRHATIALDALGESLGQPTLDGTTVVKGSPSSSGNI